MAEGGAGRRARPVVREGARRKEAVECGLEAGRLGGGGGRKPEEARRGLVLRDPEAVEVEPAVRVENEGPALFHPRPGHHRTRRERFEPGCEVRERLVPGFRPGPTRDFGQGKADMPGSGPRAREGGRDGHLRPVSSVEIRGQCAEMPVDVGDVAFAPKLVEARDGHASSPRKSRSRSCTTEAAGRSNQTPRAIPAAGSRPRTKR